MAATRGRTSFQHGAYCFHCTFCTKVLPLVSSSSRGTLIRVASHRSSRTFAEADALPFEFEFGEDDDDGGELVCCGP